jgi:hypothetical protein
MCKFSQSALCLAVAVLPLLSACGEPATAKLPTTTVGIPSTPSAVRRVGADSASRPAIDLAPSEMDQLERALPRAVVQAVGAVPTKRGMETIALVWPEQPVAESQCPTDVSQWNAYVEQSCSDFVGNLSGDAQIAWFKAGAGVQFLPLVTQFMHDANPSGVRGHDRAAYVARDFSFDLLDLNGDGYGAEFLLHVGNGPYALVRHYAALGVIDDELQVLDVLTPGQPARSRATSPVATADAWRALAETGRGQWQLYCGSRCGNTARRWVLSRDAGHTVTEHAFWACSPDGDPWQAGAPPQQSCGS